MIAPHPPLAGDDMRRAATAVRAVLESSRLPEFLARAVLWDVIGELYLADAVVGADPDRVRAALLEDATVEATTAASRAQRIRTAARRAAGGAGAGAVVPWGVSLVDVPR